MYTRGKHVLVVEDDTDYHQVFEMIVQYSGRWLTIAQNNDEALAILRSTLHPLIVIVSASMSVDGGGYGSLLLSLLANPDFAATHAFIARTDANHDDASAVAALREEIARLGIGFAAWMETPPGLRKAFVTLKEAEAYLTSRG